MTAEPSVPGGQPLKVVCTTGMVADLVRNIAAERCRVEALMGEGVDPHLYKIAPGDVRLLNEADAIFYNGLLLEGKMTDALVRYARKKPVYAVAEGIDHDLLREPSEFAGHYDPHVWFDVSLWRTCATSVRDALIEVDPAGRDEYTRRAAEYLRELETLHEWVGEQIGSIAKDRRVLVTAHDAFGYFGRAYGLEVRGIQGFSTESEASVRDINELVDFITRRGVPAVFVESSVPERNVRALVEGCRARGHEVTVGGELYSDAMGPAGTPEGTYIGMVRHNVRTIVNALK